MNTDNSTQPTYSRSSTICGAFSGRGIRWLTVMLVAGSVRLSAVTPEDPPAGSPPCAYYSYWPAIETSETCDPLAAFHNNAGGQDPYKNSYDVWGLATEGTHYEFRAGFPLNLALWYGPAAAELPPKHSNPSLGSSPLVAGDMLRSDSMFPSRACHRDIMDLATGIPLYQEIDFELPFGSAVYRQVRTHASIATPGRAASIIHAHSYQVGDLSPYFSDAAFWDWCGFGWQVGENPILLIDASYNDLQPGIGEEQHVSYFLPDSHHAIAFVKRPDGESYERPAFVDALLSRDPVHPQRYYVWMNGFSIKYTFEVLSDPAANPLWMVGPCPCTEVPCSECFYVGSGSESEPANYRRWIDAYKRPEHGGLGWPHIALLKSIEDRNGNRVEIDHVTPSIADCDDQNTTSCRECCPNINAWGQIKTVRLIPAGGGDAAWTLVYTHRPFASARPQLWQSRSTSFTVPVSVSGMQSTHWYSHQIHSIHVYRGDRSYDDTEPTLDLQLFYGAPGPDGSWIEEYDADPEAPGHQAAWRFLPNGTRITSFDSYDAIDVVEARDLPDDWEVCVSYLYEEPNRYWYYSDDCDQSTLEDIDTQYERAFQAESVGYLDRSGIAKANLLKSTVTRRDGEGDTRSKRTVYFYHPEPNEGATEGIYENNGGTLRCVFREDTLAAMEAGEAQNPLPGAGPWSANDLFLIRAFDSYGEHPNPTSEPDVYWQDPTLVASRAESGEIVFRPVRALADLSFADPGQYHSPFQVGLYVELDPQTTFSASHHRGIFIDRREDESYFRYHFFRVYEHETGWGFFGQAPPNVDPRAFHAPFVHWDPPGTVYPGWIVPSGATQVPINQSRAFHVAVVDEIEPEDCNATTWDDNLAPELRLKDFDLSQPGVIKNRTAIGINAAGIVLWTRSWNFDEGNPSLPANSGYRESVVADEWGRAIERRSMGWGAIEGTASADNKGLVEVYKYYPNWVDDENRQRPSGLKSVGVKAGIGASQSVQYTKYFERSDDDNYEMATGEYEFPTPISSLDDIPADARFTKWVYDYDDESADPNAPSGEENSTRPLRGVMVVKSAVPNEAGGIDLYSVDKQRFDDQGRLEYAGKGSATDQAGEDLEEFYCVKIEYIEGDPFGRKLREIVDVPNAGYGTRPAGFERVPTGDAEPLEDVTQYFYDDFYGVNRIIHPNDRETRIVHWVDPEDPKIMETWVFKDVVIGAEDYRYLSPVEVTRTRSNRLLWKKTIALEATEEAPDRLGDPPDYESLVIETTTAQTSPTGRVTGVTTSSGDGASLSADILYAFNGQPSRIEGPDGTITRNVYDERGRLHKVYRGTSDWHTNWGSVPPGEDPNDNLALLEKRWYGAGVTDANKLTAIRRYQEQPDDQYGQGTNEDTLGWTTAFEYDWRMREVVVTKRKNDETVMSQSFTWYDNLDRVRFSAEYGQAMDLGAGVDPRLVVAGAEIPAGEAAAILAAGGSVRPISLTESLYNSRGLIEESRTYNVASTTSPPPYLSTFTYYDYADRVSETWSPGGPVTQTTYDAVGRQRMTRSLARLSSTERVEVSKTETLYDDDNRPFVTIHSERINAANPAELDDTNSVRTFTRNWYDKAGRITDTASFGTGLNDFRYAATDPPNLTSQTIGTCEPTTANFPDALFSRYEYDAKGRQVAVHNPGGDVTRTVYDDLGRQRLVIENADAALADERRITAYDYDDAGRMNRIAAVLPTHNGGAVDEFSDITWTATDGSLQITEMIYGATVVTSAAGHAAISENETWIAEVRYPDRQTGQPSADNHLSFTYYSDGLVASRTDGLGRTFTYAYDDLSRLTEVFVTTAIVPVEGNIRIAYTYTAAGQLGTVTAYRMDSSGGSGSIEVVAGQNFFHYDPGLQNLLYERQQLDGVVTSASPTIDYQWTFAAADAGNYHRLTRMTYPTRISGGRRQINIGYAAGVDSALGRITSITDQTTNASTSYTYGGMSRRLSMLMACGIGQLFTAGTSVGAPGLDRFGRPMDLHYIGVNAPLPGASPGTVHQYEYRYDASGNRTHSRVDQQPPNWNGGGGGDASNRSWAYGYDALQRLTDADRGTATAGGLPGDPISLATTDVATEWNLDNLGNWSGFTEPGSPPTPIPGMTITYDPGPNATVDSRTHAVFQDNALESVTTQHGAANPVETVYIVNLVGSTVFDGVYYYEYDAWNRLIRVSDAGTVTAASFDSKGVLLPPAPPPNGSGPTLNVPGDWRLQYTYDGLGRLARKESPVTPGGSEARREDYRYDGVRRIQEAVTRWSGAVVIPGGEEQGASGGSNPGEPGEGDPGAVTYGGLEEPVEATELEPFGEGTLLMALPEEWDQREYVWGPDYVDELAFQFDRDGRPLYALLDANYNVMAIVAGGVRPCGNIDADPYDDTVPAGTVLEQYVWSPYGELLALDLLIPLAKGESPRNRAGHQGLFFERFDAKNTDPPLVATDPITGEGKGWYYNRNRWYDATMGRFTTADPNETAKVALSSMAMNASAFDVMLGAASVVGQYGDGANIFTIAASPINGTDPSGLAWHHLYPQYLGGNGSGPGIWLDAPDHTEFHRTLDRLIQYPKNSPQAVLAWAQLPEEVRRSHLITAASAAGIDVSHPSFTTVLDNSIARADVNGAVARVNAGRNVSWRPVSASQRFEVPRTRNMTPSGIVSKIPGANRLSALAKAGAAVSGVMAASVLLNLTDISNEHIVSLGLATRRARNGGHLSLWDEAFGLMDFYALTNDPISAGMAWRMWEDGL